MRVIGELCKELVQIKLGIDPDWLKRHRGITKEDIEHRKLKVPQATTPIAIMVDGSTDSARLDQHIVFARAIVNGRAETLFLGVRPVSDGSAEAITETTLMIVDLMFVDRSRIFFLATDGAGPMMGVHNGVGARLLRLLPFLLHVHCVDHRYCCKFGRSFLFGFGTHFLPFDRWSLGVVGSAKSVTYIKNKFKDGLFSIYSFFDNSASRSKRLVDLQQQLGDDELKMAKVGDTRWLRYFQHSP